MTPPVQKPWAILLCKFADDVNDPRRARLSDLYAQWLMEGGQGFIDANERHPFSGTGSLVKFAEGLAKIDVQNQKSFGTAIYS